MPLKQMFSIRIRFHSFVFFQATSTSAAVGGLQLDDTSVGEISGN